MELFDVNFWFTICFFIFLFAAYKPLKSSISNSLSDKVAKIESKLEDLKLLKEDAQGTLQNSQENFSSMEARGRELLLQTEAALESFINQNKSQMERLLLNRKNAEIAAMENKTKKIIDEMKTEIMFDVQKLVIEYFDKSNGFNMTDIEIAKIILAQDNAN